MIKLTANPSEQYLDKALEALDVLANENGPGNDFLGWKKLPTTTPESLFEECDEVVKNWKELGVEVVVAIGIGGSYLGAKATIEALSHNFEAAMPGKGPRVVFAGHNLSEDYHAELLEYLEGKSVAAVVISKSGTTTEPALAFRIIKSYIEAKYGKEGARERIVAVTDAARGALKTMANDEGYKTFVIPDDVGGRFSVLTPVGLIPIALAGYDIRALVKGAAAMAAKCYERNHDNIAVRYAAIRNEYYDAGKSIELLVNYNPKLHSISEWWKQLYGESEGKDGKGIFPASATFTTDLHSLGQYVQDGQRILFETMFSVEKTNKSLVIGEDAQNLDGLNDLAGKHLEYCNQMAEAGSRLSHMDGGVPCISLSMEKIDEYNLGELFYFFEVGCGVSAYMLGVNPFDQPGVEGYKKNMFALLGKPGYEAQGDELRKRL